MEGEGLAVFRQADHARLSGSLAAGWGREPWLPAQPFPAATIAARQHDDAWIPYDEAPEVRDGRPLAFHEVERVRTVELYRAGIGSVVQLDAYAGLLVSLHYSGFFTSHWGWEPFSTPDRFPGPQAQALREFLHAEGQRQQGLRRSAGLGPADEAGLELNYKLLQLWDRVSLDICRQAADRPWAIEYPPVATVPGAAATSLKLAMLAPRRYALSPYPLLANPFRATIPVVLMGAGHPTRERFLAEWRTAPEAPVAISIEAP